MKWREILMFLACCMAVPWLVFTMVIDIKEGRLIGALMAIIVAGLCTNIAVGIWSGDITFD